MTFSRTRDTSRDEPNSVHSSTLSRWPSGIRQWSLWKTSSKPLTLILVVEAAALCCLVAATVAGSATGTEWAVLALLFVLSTVFAEAVDRIEFLHRYLSAASSPVFMGPTSVWAMAGALTLPLHLALALPALVGAHTLWRMRRTRSGRPYRTAYTIATDVFSAGAAFAAFHRVAQGAVDLGQLRPALGVLCGDRRATGWSTPRSSGQSSGSPPRRSGSATSSRTRTRNCWRWRRCASARYWQRSCSMRCR